MQTICLVGEPNTGKSTLFNRLARKKISIIEDIPGVTRDRIYSKCNYNENNFYLIDTGGITIDEEDTFNKEIKVQVSIAIEEADTIIFVVDGKSGLTPDSLYIRDMLKKCNKKVVVAVNKCDNNKTQENIYDFYSLGFDEYYMISAEHNIGIKELMKSVIDESYEMEEDNELLKFSVIGRPNVGKSSLVNALLNEKRVVVSDVSGTTRDAIDTELTYNQNKYILIDTAGLRKKGRIFESVEKYSLLRSMKAIDRSNVCILVLNAEEGIVEHDKHIAGYAVESGKAIVLAVNKWDTISNPDINIKKWKKDIEHEFQFIPYAKVVFLSALSKKRIHTLMPEVLDSYENATKEIKTSIINKIITEAYIENPPATYKGKKLKIYFASQRGICPPRFDIEVNSKGLVHFSYERYLENKIRENIDFSGTPIQIVFKNKSEEN